MSMRAFVATTAPGGLALSDGVARALAPPRLFVLDQGQPAEPSMPTPTPGAVHGYDALTGVLLWSTSGAILGHPVHSPAHSVLIVSDSNGGVAALDDATGSFSFSQPLGVLDVALTPDESELLVLTATDLVRLALPGGAIIASIPHGSAGVPSQTPEAGRLLMTIDGTTNAYLMGLQAIIPVDWFAGVVLPNVPGVTVQGALHSWAQGSGRAVIADSGTSVTPFAVPQPVFHVVDTATNAAIASSPVSPGLSSYSSQVCYGPMPNGPGFLAAYWNNGYLAEITPSGGLGVVGSYSGNATRVARSTGNTDWLLAVQGALGSAGTTVRVDPATLATTQLGGFPASAIAVNPLRSDTLRVAHSSAGGTVYQLATEPVTGPPTPFLTIRTPSLTNIYVIDG